MIRAPRAVFWFWTGGYLLLVEAMLSPLLRTDRPAIGWWGIHFAWMSFLMMGLLTAFVMFKLMGVFATVTPVLMAGLLALDVARLSSLHLATAHGLRKCGMIPPAVLALLVPVPRLLADALLLAVMFLPLSRSNPLVISMGGAAFGLAGLGMLWGFVLAAVAMSLINAGEKSGRPGFEVVPLASRAGDEVKGPAS